MHVEWSLGGGLSCHGEEDCLQFSRDFEGWMNLNKQEMIGNVFWLWYLLVNVLSFLRMLRSPDCLYARSRRRRDDFRA